MAAPDKRKTVRRSIRYPGLIELGNDQPAIQCTLCDASQEGAQLFVDNPAQVPDRFTLILGYDGTARRFCRVVWRTESQVGVEFMKPPAAAKQRTPVQAVESDAPADAANDSFDIDSLSAR